MSPQWSLIAVVAIFAAGFFAGREVGIDWAERQQRHRDHVRKVARRNHPSSERGAADWYALAWATAGAWTLAVAVVWFGGFK